MVDDQQLVGIAVDRERVVGERQLAHLGMVEAFGAAGLVADVVARPEAPEPFLPAATAAFAAFAVSGLFAAVAPAFLGIVVFTLYAASVAGQLALQRVPGPRAMVAGCVGLIAGALFIIGGLVTSSIAPLVAVAVFAGLGNGLIFGAGLGAVQEESPAERRSEVASSFFVVVFVGILLPVIGVGVAAEAFGLLGGHRIRCGRRLLGTSRAARPRATRRNEPAS